jgi:hypothetical protein
MMMPVARLAWASLFFTMCTSLAGPAWSQSGGGAQPAVAAPIGKILKTTGAVFVEHTGAVIVQASLPPNGLGQAKVGDRIFQGDIIKTGPDSTANIAFADGTSFNISQNAQMELNEFVYSPNGKSNSTVYNLTKGAFTFIAGEVAHTGSMKVETPLATMGIRGTAPHVEILEDGSVKFITLIEENKKKAPPIAPGTRKAQAPAPSSNEKAEADLNSRLKICGNC